MPEAKNLLTVVGHVYHQPRDEQPYALECRWHRELETFEQPYVRKIVVTEEWAPLDLGWLKSAGVGYLVIRNEESKRFQVQPTEEELAAVNSRVVELAYRQDDSPIVGSWLVRPGETMQATPSHADRLWLRCRNQAAVVTLCLIPR